MMNDELKSRRRVNSDVRRLAVLGGIMFEECAFIAVTTTDLAQAKQFWVTLLGFAIVREDENYLMVDAGGGSALLRSP
jgi:hypothetical protein